MQFGFGFRTLNGLALVQPKNMCCHTSLLFFTVGLGMRLNLIDTSGRTVFEVDSDMAQTAPINGSFKGLQLAWEVIQ